jgi:hypothetical protein
VYQLGASLEVQIVEKLAVAQLDYMQRQPRGDEMPHVNELTTRAHRRALRLLLCACSLLLACAAPAPTSEGAPIEIGAGGADGADGADTPAGDADWCAASAVLQANCQRCHREPTENGAPFPLLTYADTQVLDRNGTPRFVRMKDAIESDYMPPNFLKLDPEVEPLTDAERALLLTWLSGQPPLDSAKCE